MQQILIQSDRRFALALVIALCVAAGLIVGAYVAILSPLYAVAAVVALVGILLVLRQVQWGLIAQICLICLLPFGALPFKIGFTPTFLDLARDIGHYLKGEPIEAKRDSTWYMLRIHPYRTQENVIEGAVLNFFDISELKQMQEALRESGMEMQALVSRLDVAREEERAAVAWELHDEIAQALAIVRNTLHDWSGKSPAQACAS